MRSVLRFASGFFPTRPHGARKCVSRRTALHAVASGSRLLPTRPVKDFHLQSSAHAGHTLAGPAVTRACPGSDVLRLAFTRSDTRTQRKSDGSIVIEGRRFEVPNRYRHLTRIEVRYASWDLAQVHLVDERTGAVLARLYPQDKTQNASGLRRSLDPVSTASGKPAPTPSAPDPTMPPLLARMLDKQATTGLAPPYLPKDDRPGTEANNDDGETS